MCYSWAFSVVRRVLFNKMRLKYVSGDDLFMKFKVFFVKVK